jgi:hypothetical protein
MIVDEAFKIQVSLTETVSRLEGFKNIFTWKVAWFTKGVFYLLLVILLLCALLPINFVLWLIFTALLADAYDVNKRESK